MKVLVRVPLQLCCTMLERCAKVSAEYQHLTRSTVSEDELTFACEDTEAMDFARWADFFAPGSGRQIQIISNQ